MIEQYRIYTAKDTAKKLQAQEYYIDARNILEAIALFYAENGYLFIEEVRLIKPKFY